jgi:hypothetical protein
MSKFLSGRQSEFKIGISSYTEEKTVLEIIGNTNISGVVTATGGFNLGISSAGTLITSGPITSLNFIGAGNTFALNGTTVDVSIAGGGSVSISTVAPSNPGEGDLWYSSILGRTYIYYEDDDGSQWVDASPFNIPEPISTPGKTSATFTATEGQTVFSYSYSAGYIDVFLNGIRLSGTEFVANNGTSITLIEGASAGDVLDVVEYTMGIGNTGPQGPQGPLSNVAQISSSDTHYPLIVSGLGSVTPYITTTTNYFSVIPSTGTLNAQNIIVGSGINVSGVVTATDFDSTSDINLKENIQVIENSLEKISQINGVTFNWKGNKKSSAGIIAQEVEKVLPEIISNNEVKTVNYNGLIALLIEAVKSQQEQINTLKEKIDNLENQD